MIFALMSGSSREYVRRPEHLSRAMQSVGMLYQPYLTSQIQSFQQSANRKVVLFHAGDEVFHQKPGSSE
jgi:hypothetical protein